MEPAITSFMDVVEASKGHDGTTQSAEEGPAGSNGDSKSSIPLVWLLLIATTVLFIVLYETILVLVEKPDPARCPRSPLDCVGVMLAMSLPWIPRSTVCRAYFWLWSVFCVHVAIFYQSKMIDILKRPLDGHQISTVAELLDSGMVIGFPANFAIHLERLNGSAERILQRRLECTSETCLAMVGGARPFATIGNRSLIEAGYLAAVTRIFLAHTRNATRQVEDHVAQVVPLRLSHFQGAYFVLALGCALAAVCCGGEIAIGKVRKRMRRVVVYPFVV
ncbi:conserved hypothetical protein [Culex quinquefasciatus]|uniref:Uncharacterized protein n=1 Tax=Culex quinquefasciatus TaxID=7176 RepID=B0XFQ4_CULQU|nr:conserved hypothetical protein [Culex quinquefasciatus]|eukprot:XP_001868476.1 conserved hypothetical protein [Culex quinquefasciatus]